MGDTERYADYDLFAALYDERSGRFAERLLPDVEERDAPSDTRSRDVGRTFFLAAR